MNRGLIDRWNSVVTNADAIYHLGDFCFTNNSGTYGSFMRSVHGRTVFIRGNHDQGLRSADYFVCKRIGGIKIFMRHWPPWERPAGFPHSFRIDDDVDLILCGHVHDKWNYHVHREQQKLIPVINVGTDAWEYKPVSLRSILEAVRRSGQSPR